MRIIEKIRIKNFKRFENITIDFHQGMNVLIGDNESGKSTVLMAIDLVLSGSRKKVEAIGLNNLFNQDCVSAFLAGTPQIATLPSLLIELYFTERNNPHLFGRNNSENRDHDGILLECKLDDTYSEEVADLLLSDPTNFPFEYYSIAFNTFQGDPFSGYRKFVRHIAIDNTSVGSDYTLRQYVGDIYETIVDAPVDSQVRNEYRQMKKTFGENSLLRVNESLEEFKFILKTDSKSSLDHDLTLTESGVPIEYKGKGKQCFIKTEFALRRESAKIEVVLIEEPENHLSHGNTRKLVEKIASSPDRQLFITTHNNLIASRLDLRKLVILDSSSQRHLYLSTLSPETAAFFMKAPDHNVLEFVLSKKVLLVEGDAEYILMDKFYRHQFLRSPDADTVNVISVDGLSFKRYLEIAMVLSIKVAVVRDNDGDPDTNCVANYSRFTAPNIKVFFDPDRARSTFETCLYRDNSAELDSLFGGARRSRTVLEYMLAEKAEVALKIVESQTTVVEAPAYIKSALQWLNA